MTLDVVSQLSRHSFVHGLSEDQISRLAAIATSAQFAENEIILGVHAQSSAFYCITSGSVAIELRAMRYAVCVQALGPGQVFGWSALLDDQDTCFQVRARETTTALKMEGAALKNLCRSDPALGMELLQRTLKVVASRVRSTEERFAEMCGVRI